LFDLFSLFLFSGKNIIDIATINKNIKNAGSSPNKIEANKYVESPKSSDKEGQGQNPPPT
jgi:hypothetical protein